MKPRRIAWALGLIAFACILLVACLGTASGIRITFDCEARSKTQPTAPVYPGSTLVAQDLSSDSPDVGAVYRYDYIVEASPITLQKFYTEKSGYDFDPTLTPTTWRFQGKATPFGWWRVFIGNSGGLKTDYSIDLSWDRCGRSHESLEGY